MPIKNYVLIKNEKQFAKEEIFRVKKGLVHMDEVAFHCF